MPPDVPRYDAPVDVITATGRATDEKVNRTAGVEILGICSGNIKRCQRGDNGRLQARASGRKVMMWPYSPFSLKITQSTFYIYTPRFGRRKVLQ